jgi:asparagine synthase (glutamine-hydrolysing)
MADYLQYLPDDILTKVDRASMACGLEVRVPLLDHRLVELAAALPRAALATGGVAKAALRRLAARRLPAALLERPKQGFGVPLAAWLRGGLRPWAEELLAPERLAAAGLLDPAAVRRCWAEHLAGQDRSGPLWAVLMLQGWLAR